MDMERALSSYPGYKFSPTEEELVLYYLRRKIEGFEKCGDVISEIDITKHEPWDLPEKSIIPSNNEWYFFSPRGKKYPKGLQSKRGTASGYWKVTGKERNVKSGTRVVGTKRTLVFHKGRAPKGNRTEWIMHEYCMSGTPQESFVVCRVRKKSESNPSDIPLNEINQALTGDSSTSAVVDDIQQKDLFNGHTDNDVENKEMFQGFTPPDRCYNPHSVEHFDSDSEYDKKPRNLIFKCSTDCFDYESECDKKPGNLYFQDESCSSPKGYEGAVDDYFNDILNDDIIKLDNSSDLPGKRILNDDFKGFKFEQPNESFPPPPLPFQGTASRRIRLNSPQRIRLVNPLPFQGTAPRRIRMKWQHMDNPVNPVEASCIRDDMYCVVADLAHFPLHLITTMSDVMVNHCRVMVLVVLTLLVVFLVAPLTRFSLRHLY